MTHDEYTAIAARYGEVALRNPRRYRWRVAGMAALGYGYIVTALVALVVLNFALAVVLERVHALVVGSKLLIVQLAVTWAVLRALWVRITPAKGIDLSRDDAPALFEAIDEVRAVIGARRVRRVAIFTEVNAGLAEYPRLGVLGWWRSDLFIGLPLLHGMDAGEVRAVIAHELAHLSHQHSRVGTLAQRAALTWRRLAEGLNTDRARFGAWIFRSFAEWYVPRLGAATLAMRRAQEFEADALAVRVAGAETHARAVVRLRVLAREKELLWTKFTAQADHAPEPPQGWYSALCREMRVPVSTADADAWLAEELAEQADPFSTHPPLGERLRAIGVEGLPAFTPVARSGADEFLGAAAERLIQRLDGEWLASQSDAWRRRYDESQAELARLAELDARAAPAPLDPADALEHAELVETWRGVDEARPMYAALADVLPEARATLGWVMLDAGDGSGVAEIERAIAEKPALVLDHGNPLAEWLQGHGRADEAARWQARAAEERAEEAAAREERRVIRKSELFRPHVAAPDLLADIRAALAAEPKVDRAWLVRRTPKHRPEREAHLLVAHLARWRFVSERERRALVRRIAKVITTFPGLVVTSADQAASGKKAARIPGALVYARSAAPAASRPAAAGAAA
jgi:Zn-dependent protease with chaperone function